MSKSQKINCWYKNLDEIRLLNLTLLNLIVSVKLLKYESALQTYNQLPLMVPDVTVQMAALIGIFAPPTAYSYQVSVPVNKFRSDS